MNRSTRTSIFDRNLSLITSIVSPDIYRLIILALACMNRSTRTSIIDRNLSLITSIISPDIYRLIILALACMNRSTRTSIIDRNLCGKNCMALLNRTSASLIHNDAYTNIFAVTH